MVEVGLRSATMRLRGEAPSNSKSLSSPPKGRREGRSRLVQVVWIDRIFASGFAGRSERSISERNMSVPSSLGRREGRLLASQKHCWDPTWAEWRREKKGSQVVPCWVSVLIQATSSTEKTSVACNLRTSGTMGYSYLRKLS